MPARRAFTLAASLLVLAGARSANAEEEAPPKRTPTAVAKPTPTLPPAHEISGTVTDPQRKPVEGAVVVARPVSWHWDRDPLAVRTDASGAFRIEFDKRTPTRFEVHVYASPLAPRRFEKVQPGTRLDVRLEKGRTVEGTVRDGASGGPVAGARVQALLFGSPSWDPEAGRVRAVADSEGRYRLQGLGPGRYHVTATARGFGRANRATGQSGQPVDLFLLPGGAISGTVVGSDKKPLAAAIVHAQDSDQRWKASSPERTDAQGRFEILGLDPGTYDLLVRLQGHAPGVIRGIDVVNDGESRADVMLEPGARVEGRLVDSFEKPVPGQVVAHELNQQPLPNEASTLLRADAGIDGRFRIDAVPSGSLTFKATAPGFAPRDVNVEVHVRETEVATGDVVLETGITIRGHVRDRSGNGIADAAIGGIGSGRPQARSEADGSYVLAGLEAGTYALFVSAPGFGGASRGEVFAGTTGGEADFVLDAVGTVTGVVVDDKSRSVESYAVSFDSKDSRHDGRGRRGQLVNAADGRFEVDVGPGEYVATISSDDHGEGIVPNVRVTSGATTDVGQVRLGNGGLLRGVVVTTDGAPVAGAAVQAGRSEAYFNGMNQAQSDANGSFGMRGLPAGKIDVLAQHPSFADGHAAGIDIDPAKGYSETKIVLGRGGRIEGFARRRDGSPLAGASVWFEPARIEGREILSGSLRQPVGFDGSFSIERVPPGHGNVVLSSHAERDQNNRSSHAVPVEIREGETTSLDLVSRDVQVSGRVSRAGIAAPGVRLRLSGRWPAHANGSATTAEDGTYSLTGTAGPATLAITAADGKSDHGWRQVILPDVDAYTLDLDIRSGASVAGIVVDEETGSAVSGALVIVARESSHDGANLRDARTDADGRFRVEVAPGDYVVRAGADGYAISRVKVAVRETGADLRLALVRGRVLRGRVIDASGRPAAGVTVVATPVEDEREPSDGTETLPDGSFRLTRLMTRPYNIVAGSSVLGFATRFPVSPGDDAVELMLQPAATLLLRFCTADGAPVAGAWARLVKVNGVSAWNPSPRMDPSDAQGRVRLRIPAGSVEIVGRKGNLGGRTTVGVGPGDSASRQIVLVPDAPPPS
jgi:protocatechuate 3,4-dioxygenase beta subunit